MDVQRNSIVNYCNAMGYKLERVIADEGISGKTLERAGVQEVIQVLTSCEYAGVIVYKLDRISRNLKDILILHDDISEKCGSSIISVKEQFDTSTATGRLFFHMIGGFAEFERNVISERLMGGRIEKAQKGKFAGGSAPFGYDLIAGKLIVNEEQATIVREVFRRRNEEEQSLQKIADWLNESGVKTKRGGKWSKVHVKDMIEREGFYKGMYKHGEVMTKGEHEAIIVS
ncbi:recombinase family protein [Tumebacillus flagellatus]|uniref:Resolvase n=1 Tax=Tumebacillus flagellatus TaxID=1157490 RepID=A0A074LQ92_9BACL|nr:recombinase family protein [Tumebacillus flagellatus]KEO83274.1 hypothetical protein EL26_11330 [Tumebacillus flagellatus]